MKKFESLAEILTFAISQEQAAYDFYIELSKRTGTEAMKKVFIDFAEQEKMHRQRLQRLMGIVEPISSDKLNTEKVSKYLSAAPNPENMTYEEAIKTAINKEHVSMMLYQILARLTEQKELRDVLNLLAQEEAHHKREFEKEYHNIQMKKN